MSMAVVPAPAGLFPDCRAGVCGSSSRPRACGAVPAGIGSVDMIEGSSPRLRGCSLHRLDRAPARRVVPAPAGLFPAGAAPGRCAAGRPRACGAVPGWWQLVSEVYGVVPAPAGLFRTRRPRPPSASGRPRACGAVPPETAGRSAEDASSPRLRGCSGDPSVPEGQRCVVPAPAGLFPPAPADRSARPCRPRACGAVPADVLDQLPPKVSSPRLRGCSPGRVRTGHLEQVVPAPAGLFPHE